MELDKLTLDELVALNKKIEAEMNNREDGFFYIVNIRSFGSVVERKYKNEFLAEEDCSFFNGDNGIAEVYTNNEKCKIQICGSKYFIDSEENYHLWKSWTKDKSTVERYEEMGTLPDLLAELKEEFEKLYSNKTITEPIEI